MVLIKHIESGTDEHKLLKKNGTKLEDEFGRFLVSLPEYDLYSYKYPEEMKQ